MRLARFLLAATIGSLALITWRSEAQFYAPETEYHDRVQRVFVVEAARVMAFWFDRDGTNIAQVTYTVETRTGQKTVWEIRWLDPSGKPLKSATVSYGPEVLKGGPEFYRSVLSQLDPSSWKNPPHIDARETSEGYWRGAAKAGVSREESLRVAFDLVRKSEGRPEAEWIPELSGLLVHAALPGTADPVSLDGVMLARAAALLAMAERSGATKLDVLWAPILFQAGREHAAAQLWQKTFVSTNANTTAQQAGWNIWMRKPTSKEVYLYAIEPANLTMAVPMLVYDAQVNQTGRLLAEMIERLVGSERKLWQLHNYAPFFAVHTSISGGHILNGAWPVFNRKDWLSLLGEYSARRHDYQGYLDALRAVTNSLSTPPKVDENLDASLVGLREMAPLLRLGHSEGIGVLAPTATVTPQDLLNYGWEMTGRQMSRRYEFVRRRWGVPEQAEPILKVTTGELPGLIPFFQTAKEAKVANYWDSVARLQLLDGFFPGGEEGTEAGLLQARLCVQRTWLRPGNVYGQCRWLGALKAGTEVTQLIEAIQTQGGMLAGVHALRYLNGLQRNGRKEIPRADELQNELAEALPEPTELYVESVYEQKFRKLGNFARGQELERLYWKNPDSGLEQRVFRNYVVSGSFKSAKRFYSQSRDNIMDPVGFSNTMGKMGFVLGCCLEDESLRRMAMEDSRSASYSDMMMHIWNAAWHDNARDLEKNVQEINDRYEQNKGANSRGRKLARFLPLLPALRDPKHASRREALEYFGKAEDWTVLRWIWIDRFKMPVDDAIVFLGGRENDHFRLVMIACLENDQPKALEALNKLTASKSVIDENTVLAAFLYSKLHALSPPHEEPDLKPEGTMSVVQAVRAIQKSK